jgi:BirA family biotin operon repressor/biotin-[acetyl-CoA-carboxylase] ligase
LPKKANFDELQAALRTTHFGRGIFFRRQVKSTNDWAKELAAFGAEEGTVAIADTQTAGRGRLERKWFSPKGGLWFSIILRPKLAPVEATRLVFIAGLAVAETLHEEFGLDVDTKWPNDVLLNGKKVCGILLEMNSTGNRVNYVVMGIGLNVNFKQEDFSLELEKVATTLKHELGGTVQIDVLFMMLLEKLERNYQLFLEEGFEPIIEGWKENASFLGKKVDVTDQHELIHGLALDVDQDGALIVSLENGKKRRVLNGDVILRTS